MDVDGNNTIENNEWEDWMIKGCSKSTYIRDKFQNAGSEFKQLGFFLEYVSKVAQMLTDAAAEAAAEKAAPPSKSNILLQQQRQRIKTSDCLRTSVAAFASLSEEHLHAIIDTMTFEEYDDDDPLIVEQGKIAECVYVVLAGQVSIMAASGEQGWPAEKGRIGELAVFGVEALLGIENQRYSISGVACDDHVQTMCLRIPDNPIFSDKAEEIIAAARESRKKMVAAKFGKKLHDRFRASRKSE